MGVNSSQAVVEEGALWYSALDPNGTNPLRLKSATSRQRDGHVDEIGDRVRIRVSWARHRCPDGLTRTPSLHLQRCVMCLSMKSQ